MEIEEKAKNYAEGKAISAITAAIEKAYIDGYESGYQDGCAKSELPKEVIDGVEYVDLKLPSGTKWSSTILLDDRRCAMFLPYDEASKLNIPTAEQYQELLDFCVETGNSQNTQFVGANGNNISISKRVILRGNNVIKDSGSHYNFWLKSEEKDQYRLYAQGVLNERIREQFAGDRMTVMLVH